MISKLRRKHGTLNSPESRDMPSIWLKNFALVSGLSAAVFAPAAFAASESTLYSFKDYGKKDGSLPNASLTYLNGAFYGTTLSGGASTKTQPNGTVFKLTPAGAETVLYSFKGEFAFVGHNIVKYYDGGAPESGLTYLNGTFYGTTTGGGDYNQGVLYSVTPSGVYTVLHHFKGGATDGAVPEGNLIAFGGFLYGVTNGGGKYGGGTVFAFYPPTRDEGIEHSFGGAGDGTYPTTGLIVVDNALWGTAPQGGATGNGAVFSFSASGERVVYSFKGGTDGFYASGSLLWMNGTFYGTTGGGGTKNFGTIFTLTPGGTHKVLYSFNGLADGTSPITGMTNLKGTLYGIASSFGGGLASIFKLSPTTGVVSVVYTFTDTSQGYEPTAGLIGVGNALYGTNALGGANGAGTVFKVVP